MYPQTYPEFDIDDDEWLTLHIGAAERRLLRILRLSPYLLVVEVEGKLWLSDSYWIVPVTQAAWLFQRWNLTPAPGYYSVDGEDGGRLSPWPDHPGDASNLLPPFLLPIPGAVTLTPRTYGQTDLPVLVRQSDKKWPASMWKRASGTDSFIAAPYADWVADNWPAGGYEVTQGEDTKGHVQFRKGGELVGVVMPLKALS